MTTRSWYWSRDLLLSSCCQSRQKFISKTCSCPCCQFPLVILPMSSRRKAKDDTLCYHGEILGQFKVTEFARRKCFREQKIVFSSIFPFKGKCCLEVMPPEVIPIPTYYECQIGIQVTLMTEYLLYTAMKSVLIDQTLFTQQLFKLAHCF